MDKLIGGLWIDKYLNIWIDKYLNIWIDKYMY